LKERVQDSMDTAEKDKQTDNMNDRYISVASDCQAIYRIVPENETGHMSKSLEASIFHVPTFPALESMDPAERVYESKDEIDADLMELLLSLDWKLNLLLKTMSPLKDETIYPHRAFIKEISVGTLKIETSTTLVTGTTLAFHFVLPILPFKELFLRGKVVRSGAQNDHEYDVFLDPDFFKEADREHLTRYVVRRQFQIKRENTRSS